MIVNSDGCKFKVVSISRPLIKPLCCCQLYGYSSFFYPPFACFRNPAKIVGIEFINEIAFIIELLKRKFLTSFGRSIKALNIDKYPWIDLHVDIHIFVADWVFDIFFFKLPKGFVRIRDNKVGQKQ